MTHLSETLVQAYLDEEITPAVTEEVELHLMSCAVCRASADELAQLAARLSDVVRQVDRAEPAEWSAAPLASWHAEETRRKAHHVRPIPRRSVVRDGGGTRAKAPVWQWAAIILVSVTGIASAAMVAVPWLLSKPPVASPPPIEASPPSAPPTALSDAGAIAVSPTNGEMSVALSDAAEGSRVFVRLADRMDVFVSLRSDSLQSDPALFKTGDGRVEVGLANRVMMVYVEFPRALRSGRVLVGDQVVARVLDSRLDPPGVTERGVPVGPSR